MSEQLYRIRPIEWIIRGDEIQSRSGTYSIQSCEKAFLSWCGQEIRLGYSKTIEAAIKVCQDHAVRMASVILEPVQNSAIEGKE